MVLRVAGVEPGVIGSTFEEGAEARCELVERPGFECKPGIHGLAARPAA